MNYEILPDEPPTRDSRAVWITYVVAVLGVVGIILWPMVNG